MLRKTSGKIIEWERLTNLLLYGVSKIRQLPPADRTISLYDDLMEIGATEQETRFLIRQARRLGIQSK